MAWVMAAAAVAGTATSMTAQKSAADKAKKAAYAQASMYERQMQHDIDRTKRQHRIMEGQTTARIYASGIDMAGSPYKHKLSMGKQMDKDMAAMVSAKEKGARAIRKGAQLQHDAARWNMYATAFQGFGQAAGAFSNAGYGQKPATSTGQRNMAGGFG